MAKMSFRDRMIRFMYGRYGADKLGNFLLIVSLVLTVVDLILGWFWLSVLVLALIVYTNYRMMSRKIWKRQHENAVFCKILDRVKKFFSLQRSKWRDRKTHVFRKCPHCKNVLRLPKQKGKHTVGCPCCHNRFEIKV